MRGIEWVLEALIWSYGFSNRQAFIQAVDGRWRFRARFKPVAATVGALYICAICKKKSAQRSVGVHVQVDGMYLLYRCTFKVQDTVVYVCLILYVMCVC